MQSEASATASEASATQVVDEIDFTGMTQCCCASLRYVSPAHKDKSGSSESPPAHSAKAGAKKRKRVIIDDDDNDNAMADDTSA